MEIGALGRVVRPADRVLQLVTHAIAKASSQKWGTLGYQCDVVLAQIRVTTRSTPPEMDVEAGPSAQTFSIASVISSLTTRMSMTSTP